MEFKEFKKLKKSIRSFFIKSDIESLEEAINTIDLKRTISNNRKSFDDYYSINSMIRDLENVLSNYPNTSMKDNFELLLSYGIQEDFLLNKLKEKPLLLEAEDEVELLSEVLGISTIQAQSLVNVKDEKMQKFDNDIQSKRYEIMKETPAFKIDSCKWQQEDLDKIYKPSTLGDTIRYEWHKLSEAKKLDKLISLVDSNKISISQMRTILSSEANSIIPKEIISSTGSLAIPDKLLFSKIKENKTLLIDNHARYLTLRETINDPKASLNNLYAQTCILFDCPYGQQPTITNPNMQSFNNGVFHFDPANNDSRVAYLQKLMHNTYNNVMQQNLEAFQQYLNN